MMNNGEVAGRKRGPPGPPTLSDLEAEPLGASEPAEAELPPAKKPMRRYASRGAGFSGQETAALLALLQAQLPVSKDEWEAVARMHAVRFPTLNRSADTLRRKLARLNQAVRADEQPRASRDASLARIIHANINKRSQYGDAAGAPVDLAEPLGSEREDDEDEQPATLLQAQQEAAAPLTPADHGRLAALSEPQLIQQMQEQAPSAPTPAQQQPLPVAAATASAPAPAASTCATCNSNASKWDELLVMMRVSMLAMQQQREQDAADRRRRDEEDRARREDDRRRWEEQRAADRERLQHLLDTMAQSHKTIELLVAAVISNSQHRE